MAGLARLFRPAALIFENPVPAVLAQAIDGAKLLELAVLIAGSAEDVATTGTNGVISRRWMQTQAGPGRCSAPQGSLASLAACGRTGDGERRGGAGFIAFDTSNPETWEEAVDLAI